jgi:hypothetical protein
MQCSATAIETLQCSATLHSRAVSRATFVAAKTVPSQLRGLKPIIKPITKIELNKTA